MHKQIIEEVEKILGTVYLVGGCVRDIVLEQTPKDYDFTTPLLPDEIEKRVRAAGRRPYLTGKKFGTIGFKVMLAKKPYFVEVTTFRTEIYRTNNRKPEVEFVDNINHDLSRRDFTVNAMAIRNNKVTDPFKGKEDIKNKIIRCVGKPADRFKEDPLRMLRAIRFATKLNFTIEEDTLKFIQKKAHRILQISKERWMMEINQILMSENVSVGLNYLAESQLLKYMFPELSLQIGYDQNTPHHKFELWTHTVKTVSYAPATLECRWAALLHDVGKPFTRTEKPDRSNYIKHDMVGAEIVTKYSSYLKWSNQLTEDVQNMVLNHMSNETLIYAADRKAHHE